MTSRIDLVSEHASPLALVGGTDAGGQNVHVASLACALARLGADVVVHTRRDDPSLAEVVPFVPGVRIHHVDAGPAVPLPKDELLPYMDDFADELSSRWLVDRPDIVHAHFWMSGYAAVTAAEPLEIPTMLTYHALGREKRREQGLRDSSPPERLEIEEWLARSVDHVVATTAAERSTVIEMGARPDSISVVPCGVDLDHFRPTGTRWPPPAKRFRVVCVGRLVPRKGLTEVVRAVAQLPATELVVIGGPPDMMLTEDPHAAAVRDLAAELGVEERVHLLGAIGRRDIPAILRSASAVCCAPWYEPFGLVALEAMACGVPVVASDVGGLAETVVDGVTGLLVPPRDPDAIAGAVRRLMDDAPTAARMRAAALRRSRRYGWPEIAARTLRVMDEVQQVSADRHVGTGGDRS